MKCVLIHRPGLWGTLVHISRGLQLKTHEYLRTHWDSSIWPLRGREAGLCALTPSWCTFSNFDLCRPLGRQHFKSFAVFCCWIFFPVPLTIFKFYFAIIESQICLQSLVSVVFESHWGRWRDEHLSFLPLCPAQPAGCQRVEEIEMR